MKDDGKERDGEESPTLTGLELTQPSETGTVSALFPSESLLTVAAKLAAVESFLSLSVRDLKFNEFMRELLLTILRAVPSEAGSLLELDHQRRNFFFRAVVGQSSERVNQFVIPFGQGIVGHVAESRQPLCVDDLEENRVHLRSIQNAVGFETRNMAAVPIVIRGKVFAVLELLNRVGETGYTPADIELLTYLCGAAAKVIEARLTLNWALKSKGSKNGGEAA